MSVLSMQQLQQQQQTRGSPHILPPLQPQQTSIGLAHQIYGQSASSPHTPRTPNTPHTPISAGGNGSFPHIVQQTSPYLQSPQSYSSPASLMSPVSVAHPHPQPIAPAPVHGRSQVPLRPMPSGSLSQIPQSMNSQYDHSQVLSQPPLVLNQEAQPMHVVGSQGRRGILPSAPGRAAAVSGAGGSKNASIPVKDADGKFPCPHCHKSYLHAKHLKRHLLRREFRPPSTLVASVYTNIRQIPEIARICACFVGIRSHGVIYLSAIFKNVLCVEVIRLVRAISRILKHIIEDRIRDRTK
ncbi:MAG: hypothetical protein M1813_008271 [Trichoglossum hirsutum]|nr:MAG: hypothetical protein M1813_008271 [Trichoglossum hirsutum]